MESNPLDRAYVTVAEHERLKAALEAAKDRLNEIADTRLRGVPTKREWEMVAMARRGLLQIELAVNPDGPLRGVQELVDDLGDVLKADKE